MTASKAPWKACGRADATKYGETYLEDADGKCLLTSDGCFNIPDDCWLAASAPDLLQALEEATNDLCGACLPHDHSRACRARRAVIARAKGEA